MSKDSNETIHTHTHTVAESNCFPPKHWNSVGLIPDPTHRNLATRTGNGFIELDDARFYSGHDRAVAAAVGKPKVLRFSAEGSDYTADDFGAGGDFNEMYRR